MTPTIQSPSPLDQSGYMPGQDGQIAGNTALFQPPAEITSREAGRFSDQLLFTPHPDIAIPP